MKKKYLLFSVLAFIVMITVSYVVCRNIDLEKIGEKEIDRQLFEIIVEYEHKDFEKAKTLIKNGADVNYRIGCPEMSYTPLMRVVSSSPESIDFLVKNGADVNAKSNDALLGWLYAHFVQRTFNAMSFNVGYNPNMANVRALVENGIDLNWQNNVGQTALMIAAIWNNKDIVKYLIEKGADINIKDKSGKTALDHAKIRDNKESAEILQQGKK